MCVRNFTEVPVVATQSPVLRVYEVHKVPVSGGVR